MPQYFYHIKDQTNWPETIVLVQIFGPDDADPEPVARVRSVYGLHPDGNMPLPYALAEAERVRLQNQLDSIGVYLDEGAKWDASWGELVDQKGLGLP